VSGTQHRLRGLQRDRLRERGLRSLRLAELKSALPRNACTSVTDPPPCASA